MIQRILMQTTLLASLTFVSMGSAYAQDSVETEGAQDSEETSANEEAPAAENAPTEAEPAPSEEAPAAEETPTTEEAPAVENAPAPAAAASRAEVEEAPLSRVELKAIPPRFSYDLGIQFGYGEITYWKEEVPAWATLGFAMAWGKHFNSHRIGMGFAFVAEGPIPVHSSIFLEPTVRWDAIFGWLQLGASVGPAVGFHHAQRTVVHESKWDVGPVGSLRVGWSQPYTRLGRRLHVVLEPKVRMVDGRMNPTVAVYVGSGRGY